MQCEMGADILLRFGHRTDTESRLQFYTGRNILAKANSK